LNYPGDYEVYKCSSESDILIFSSPEKLYTKLRNHTSPYILHMEKMTASNSSSPSPSGSNVGGIGWLRTTASAGSQTYNSTSRHSFGLAAIYTVGSAPYKLKGQATPSDLNKPSAGISDDDAAQNDNFFMQCIWRKKGINQVHELFKVSFSNMDGKGDENVSDLQFWALRSVAIPDGPTSTSEHTA
jgi:hypothetical protein